jgi:hypothetical protein
MAYNNAANINVTGVVSLSSAGVATGSSLTQFDVLVGGASNAISSIGPGSAGQVLQSGGNAANPAYSTATYPSTAGSSGNVLTSNGTNWVSQASSVASNAFNQVVVQVFTSSGTYTPTTGMKYCTIECVGSGGGGGGAAITSPTEFSAGGGGGGGGYARKTVTAATVGVNQTVTINAGGNGGTGAANGSNGGSVSVGALCVSGGGFGGSFIGAITSALNTTMGGASGVATTGDFLASGQSGMGALGSSVTNQILAGGGGNSIFGGGAVGGTGATAAGTNGNNYGGGGSGAIGGNSNGSSRTGGTGANGIVIVTEYISV